MKKASYYNQILTTLKTLHSVHPKYTMGQHLSTSLDGYRDIWGISDKEFLFALEKYVAELEYDVPRMENIEIDVIIKEGMNLNNLIIGEEYDDETFID